MNFDDILHELGEFGFYQKRMYFLLCIPAISVGCFMMGNIILLYTPDHRCKIPDLDNDTWEVNETWHQNLINQYIPPSLDYYYDRCHLYRDGIGIGYDNMSRPVNASEYECTEWVYSKQVFKESFSSQQNFVCGDSLKTSHLQLVYYFGVLVGDLGFGLLSDVIGRKKALCLSAILQVSSAMGVAFAPNFWVYLVLEFLVGAACHGVFMSCCVLGLEVVGPSKRVWAGIIIHGFFTVGLCYLSGAAWLLQQWSYIQIAIAAPCALYPALWWLIPESPRWLISMNRQEEAETIIRHMAKVNNRTLPETLLMKDTVEKQNGGMEDSAEKQKGGKFWKLFTNKVLFFRTMILFFNWTIVSMCYYGVTMYAGTIGGNFFLNFFLLALVEYPAFVCIPMLMYIGRKWTHVAFMWLGGFACLGTIFTVVYGGDDWHAATLVLSLIGKLGPSGAFAVIYIFSLELYPTLLRNAGMGASSCVARFGGMAAPYVAKMGELIGGDFGKALPLAIFGITSVIAGLLCLMLPETLNQKLPDTAEEAAKFKGRNKRQEIEINLPQKIKSIYVSEETNGVIQTKL